MSNIHIVIEILDGETVVAAAFVDEDKADAHRDTIVREYAKEADACGSAPDGLDLDGDTDELAEALNVDVTVHAAELRE